MKRTTGATTNRLRWTLVGMGVAVGVLFPVATSAFMAPRSTGSFVAFVALSLATGIVGGLGGYAIVVRLIEGELRVVLGNASDVEIDSASRVLVSPELRASAKLTRDVMLLGMGSHFELWDAAAYAEHEAQVMQSEMPDALKGFSF